jgi:lysine 2,3-aminomutase
MKKNHNIEVLLTDNVSQLLIKLKRIDPLFYRICGNPKGIAAVRNEMFQYLANREEEIFKTDPGDDGGEIPSVNVKLNAKECIRVLKNIFRTKNESRTGFSALSALHDLISSCPSAESHPPETIGPGFILEILFLVKGMDQDVSEFLPQIDKLEAEDPETSVMSTMVDVYGEEMKQGFTRFLPGFSDTLTMRSIGAKQRILDYYHASEKDWHDYKWHLRHVFTDRHAIGSVVFLSESESAGLEEAERNGIPVQITPYYLSLFNPDGKDDYDRAIRAQVLPSVGYCTSVSLQRESGADMDFMGEHATSPIEGITRRYPSIVILKPYDSCPQLCVYCQRNWEIRDISAGAIKKSTVGAAIRWIAENDRISEVLVTGGDPLTLSDKVLRSIIKAISDIPHIQRIRIGTRTIVTLPCRITDGFLDILQTFHEPGRRELAVITHVEHVTELTREVINGVAKIRKRGIGVYNQQVFTYFNSRKFETAFLRRNLRLCGIDPYYTFNMKGKDETKDFRVPIARLLQERKEEARLLSGLERTDEPVFNVPKLGKSHLRSWQHHEPVMILADGRRVYRFLPWESRLTHTSDYLFTDVSIFDYLTRLRNDGEDVHKYQSLWYYF